MSEITITDTMLYINHINGVFCHKRNPEITHSSVSGRYCDALLYVTDGMCRYDFNTGQTYTVQKGDVFFLPKGSSYNMTTKGLFCVLYCDFSFDTDSQLKPDIYKYTSSVHIGGLFNKLYSIYSTPSKTSLHKSISLLYTIYEEIVLNKNTGYIGTSSRNKISNAKNYMDIHFTESTLTIESIANMINMSEVHFRKLFKSQYNTSPLQYILNLKIDRAKRLMRSEILSLEECAIQSGFATLQYFARIFKQKTGITPAKYRKSVINKD